MDIKAVKFMTSIVSGEEYRQLVLWLYVVATKCIPIYTMYTAANRPS